MTHEAATALLALGALIGAWLDARYRRLPNWLCALTAIAGLAVVYFEAGPTSVAWAGAHAILALIIGMVLFRLGMVGGGDAKFYSACAAWLPLQWGLTLLLSVSLAGLLLVVVWFSIRGLRRSRNDAEKGKYAQVPYGVAIAVGALAARVMA